MCTNGEVGDLRIELFSGLAKYRWGLGITLDFCDGFTVEFHFLCFYFGMMTWRVWP